MLSLSGFELYSCWVPLVMAHLLQCISIPLTNARFPSSLSINPAT